MPEAGQLHCGLGGSPFERLVALYASVFLHHMTHMISTNVWGESPATERLVSGMRLLASMDIV